MTVNRMSKTSLAAPTKFRNFRAGNVEVTGGSLSEDSIYFYRTFKSSGTLSVAGGSLVADILTIAGGGGGGDNGSGGGGGGAGGILLLNSQTLNANNHSVIIGAGGSGAVEPGVSGQGSTSMINSLTGAIGGGRGASGGGNTAGSGGSGGGAGGNSGLNGGGGIVGQGTQGGYAASGQYAGAGGGGASTAGSNGAANNGGNGGIGTAMYSAWTTVTGTGSSGYLAGGGGGGSATVGAGYGAGGTGGGGNGGVRTSTYPTAGLANTGGGGGAGGGGSSGTAGGSGLVIVRYAKTAITSSFADYEHIGTISLSASTSAVTFTGLPVSQYKHLQIRATARTDRAATSDNVHLRFNGDTGANYFAHVLYGASASTASGAYTSQSLIYCAGLNGNTSATNAFGTFIVDVLDPFSTSKNKSVRSSSGLIHTGTDNQIAIWSGAWNSFSAVNSITLTGVVGSFMAGSRFSIYGLRG